MKVLDSVRVLEIGGIGPGPFCAMHLADLGADVVSIVRPEAEPTATSATSATSTASALSRGKRSVFADLKSPEGRDLVLALVRDADFGGAAEQFLGGEARHADLSVGLGRRLRQRRHVLWILKSHPGHPDRLPSV